MKPTNPKLYAKVKSEAKKKFDVYPSAYANGWLVKEYKRRGGGYKKASLDQWFKEKWVDVSKKGDHAAGHAECGRDKAEKKGYPKCVPASKAKSMSKKEKRSAVQRKRKALSKKKGLPKKPVMVKTDMEKSALQKIAAKYKGKKVTLNKPISTPGARKKSKVYVKNDKGNVVMVRFGDPNMSIKKDDPARRKSFRARHNCDNPGPKWKARYWSCKAW